MDEALAFENVLSDLYDAAVDLAGLPLAARSMTAWLDGDTCHMFALSKRTGAPLLSVSHGLSAEIGPEYAAHYAGLDPRRALVSARHDGLWVH